MITVDEEVTRLRRALDIAIYSLEQIRRRADSGASSPNPDWDCLVIAEAAEAAVERIAEHCREREACALHPALEHHAKYESRRGSSGPAWPSLPHVLSLYNR